MASLFLPAIILFVSLIQSGGNTSIGAKTDITVTGSVVRSGLDTAIIAGRDVTIVPGEEGRDSEYYHKVSGLGISLSSNGSGVSLFAGYQAITDKSSFHGSYTAASLVTAGNDLTIQAGNNVNQIGSDLAADNDAWITAGGIFVSLAAAPREVMDKFHEELRIGITASVQVGALQTAQTIAKAIDRIGGGVSGGRGGGEGITNAIAIAQIAGVSASYGRGITDAYLGGAGSTNAGGGAALDKALGLSASISFGASQSQSSSHSESETARVSTIRTVNDLDITAKSIALQGTQVASLGNLYLTATDGDVAITAAKNGFLSSSSSSSWGASIGLGWSLSPSTGSATSTGITVSANASQSNSTSSGTSFTNATLSSGGLLSVLAKRDIGIEGGNLRGETAKINAGRDFWIASVQGTSTSTSSSSGFNASLTFGPGGVPTSGSAGVNGSSGAGDKAWTDKPSSLTAAGTLDITVGQQTSVLGALINSDKDRLTLTTKTLVTADLTDRDVYQSSGGGITVGFGGGFPIKTVSFDIQDRGKDGITRATIGLGNVTITGVTPAQAADALTQINRDPKKLQEVLKSWDFAAGGSLDVDTLVKLPENLQALAKAFEALSAPVPDDVSAMGDRAEQIFRRMIANGMSVEAATAATQSEAFVKAINRYNSVDAIIASGRQPSALELSLLAQGEALLYGENGQLELQVACPTSASRCKLALAEFEKVMSDEKRREVILAGLEAGTKDWLRESTGGVKGTIADAGALYATLLKCAVDEPAVFTEFLTKYNTEYYQMGASLGLKRDQLEALVRSVGNEDKSSKIRAVFAEQFSLLARSEAGFLSSVVGKTLAFAKFAEDVQDPQWRAETAASVKATYAAIEKAFADDPSGATQKFGSALVGVTKHLYGELNDFVTDPEASRVTDVAVDFALFEAVFRSFGVAKRLISSEAAAASATEQAALRAAAERALEEICSGGGCRNVSVGDVLKGAGIEVGEYVPKGQVIGQAFDYTCVAASCRMIMSDKGIMVAAEEAIANALKTTSNGVSVLQSAKYLTGEGIPATAFPKASIAELEAAVSSGRSAIVGINVPGIGAHAVVIDGISAGMVLVRDPLRVKFGSSYGIPLQDFGAFFSGRMVSF